MIATRDLAIGTHRICPACRGRGQVVMMGPATRPAYPSEIDATRRHGRRHPVPCHRCTGVGIVETRR